MEEDIGYQDIIDTFVEDMKKVGIELNQDEVHFRGFGSQGDGASFDFKLLNLTEVKNFLNLIGYKNELLDKSIKYFDTIDIYTSKNSFSTNYCHERTRNIDINWQFRSMLDDVQLSVVKPFIEQMLKDIRHYVTNWYVNTCKEFYSKLEKRFYDILDHENESEELTISDRIDSMIDPEMNIEKVVEMVKKLHGNDLLVEWLKNSESADTVTYKEEFANLQNNSLSKFIEDFNNKYLIIKKDI